MDDDLRLAIDRIVKEGGRLTADAAVGENSVVLEQPGSRFGILEVTGRLRLAPVDERPAVDLSSLGWTDPTVTYRLGREIRLPRADPDQEGPITLTRTWRVPPSLAAEIADAVRGALGEVGRVDFVPLPTRASLTGDGLRQPRPPTEQLDIDDPGEWRPSGRTVPAPLKGLLGLAVIVVVAFAWAGMIRGAPRDDAAATAEGATPVAGGAPQPGSPTPSMLAASSPSVTDPSHFRVVRASTEEHAWPAAAAVDGDPVTAWHADVGVPQWIEIGLESPTTVRQLVLLIAQAETGPTRHLILIGVTGQALQVVGVVDQPTADGDSIEFRPDTPLEDVDRIRIETMVSPSNAGWYEVIVR